MIKYYKLIETHDVWTFVPFKGCEKLGDIIKVQIKDEITFVNDIEMNGFPVFDFFGKENSYDTNSILFEIFFKDVSEDVEKSINRKEKINKLLDYK